MSVTIGLDQTFNILARIVQDFGPDHRAGGEGQEGCTYYTSDGKTITPVCIVGQFFHRLGLMAVLFSSPTMEYVVEQAETRDGMTPDQHGSCSMGGGGSAMRDRAREFGVNFDDDAWELLVSAQRVQDGNSDVGDTSWGSALREAAAQAHAEATRNLPTTALITRAELLTRV